MWLYALAALAALFLLRRWYRERQTVPGLPEKFVLITGCDSGFGNLLARQLDARGLRVLAACQSEEGAERLRAAASPRLQTLLLDVTSSPSIAAAAAWVKERVGDRGLWGLVNNAGTGTPSAPNEWLSKEDFLKVINVNLIGLIEVTLSVLPLVRRARGRVVNVASVMGRVSFFGGGYCISKFGVEAFSDSLRLEMRNFGVKVSIIEPGYFQTNITNGENIQKHFLAVWEKLPEEIKADYGEGYLKHFLESFRTMKDVCSPNLALVTGCMEHALTSRYPRCRYAAGWDAKLLYIPLSYAPTALSDRLFAKHQPLPARRA
ncbi:retinol dehydrogenase 16-like [Neopsephotus bourkii]|uniref:retinol dehydrogenase 16-like n=1 Tax=Neopsephotus bourkii TaxID=309878 RepID=UPI002AA593EC|nr:retinol dehydrogenase 16-like [Neopsephotus bourkii]